NRASLGQQCVAAGRKQRERVLASNLLARQTDEHGGFRDHERQCLFTPDDVRDAGNVHQPAAVPHRPTRDQCDVQALHITLASSCRRLGSLNLSSSSAVMSTLLALPSSISSAVTIPAAGACISPWPEKPAQTYAPSRCPSLSITGWWSGVTSYRPAHLCLGTAFSSTGARSMAVISICSPNSSLKLSLKPADSLWSLMPISTPPDSRWKYSVVDKSTVMGNGSAIWSNLSVTMICRRIGSIGTSMPAMAATLRVQAPVHSTSLPQRTSPRFVSTPTTWRPSASSLMPVTSTLFSITAPWRRAALAKPWVMSLGSPKPSRWWKVAPCTPSMLM